ncbi:leukocyte tyrosine kinase receptor-like [Uloborus diversus]|uniref:leukocyte tyrosine kinase receptor-like n=1 Tax=Uloborus diversus TaxID=327109 RepID=UPI00240A89D6|nr:leukocyte tyrosine kinase receptor-like [Uloborus diversus]
MPRLFQRPKIQQCIPAGSAEPKISSLRRVPPSSIRMPQSLLFPLLSLWLCLCSRLCHGMDALPEHCEDEFSDPDCGWSWSEGWSLLSAENTSLLGPTAPSADARNNSKGLLLYHSPGAPGAARVSKLEVRSGILRPPSLPDCSLRLALHMYQMENARFQLLVQTDNDRTTWESARFSGDSAHKWESQSYPIGTVSQPLRLVLEITFHPPFADPSHLALDDLAITDCYSRRRPSGECTGRQFQCPDVPLCMEPSDICDITADCRGGEDEKQDCDKLLPSASCTFEYGICGWNNSRTGGSQWILGRGETPNFRTGPSHDHTYQNESGTYLMASFEPGRNFGRSTVFTSPWFPAPPSYHRNIHSAYYNSCQVRFYYHKYGQNMGELRVYGITGPDQVHELWRSFGNKGDAWRKATVSVQQENSEYQIMFSAARGVGHSDIAIDDVTLSPECFGIGVPENESNVPELPTKASVPEPQQFYVQKYEFNPCGATGRSGPSDALCRVSYKNTSSRVVVLSDPGWEGVQRWTVPHTGLYTIFVRGAGGGSGMQHRGSSRGASLRATFEWKKDENIYMLVGQKGIDPCGELRQMCEDSSMPDNRKKRSISKLFQMNKVRNKGSGGGGGGGTYLFKVDPTTYQRVPVAVAGGGGGLSAKLPPDPSFPNVPPHGLAPNSSLLPINGYTGPGAGGGGGWDDRSPDAATAGRSLLEGSLGGVVCEQVHVWKTDGGFGGGGGACGSGGGGGGYRGGDAWDDWNDTLHNGQGGTSFLTPIAIRAIVQPGSNPGDGSVVIIPAQPGCGCEHLCVHLDLEGGKHYCICPPPSTLDIDGYSCSGHPGMSVSPKVLVVIIMSVVVFLSLLTICIFVVTNRYRKLHRRSRGGRDVSDEPLTTDPDEQLRRLRGAAAANAMVSENNPNYEFGGNTCTEQDLKKVPREQLTLVKALGQGAFGEVYQGFLTNPNEDTQMPVAVKTLPELSSSQSIFDFLMEALIMSKFKHPNIVSFIGVCFEKMPRFIVLELLPGGDLKSFLRECRPKPNKPSTLTVTDLLLLSLDVAKGCQYLEANHFIHRDIAARNCLLTTKEANRVVKIADFGMARDIYRADYYRKGGKAMLPVKWMPPEAFLDGIFTSKTDVWSFGVLLWEVISLGYMPYPGRFNQEVMQFVMSGGRLEPPTNCPGPIYHIMMQCWHPTPDERPNFSTIIERIGYCLQDPDVINAPLPIFYREPSMERDATIMRPVEDDGVLTVQRVDPGLLLSPGSEDYLIPTGSRSSYSLTTTDPGLSSPGSADQLMELEERGGTPGSSRPQVWETHFMSGQPPAPPTPTEPKPNRRSGSHAPMTRQGGYAEVPTDEPEEGKLNEEIENLKVKLPDETSSKSSASRLDSIKSLDDLPVGPSVGDNENEQTPSSRINRSNLSLDPGALVRQMSSEPQTLPNRYINVDVNCNTGDGSTGSLTANQNAASFDGYAGVNPVA